jgi:hypothetical protein
MGSNNETHCFTAVDSCVAQRSLWNFTLDNPRLVGAGFAFTSEVWTYLILIWLKLWNQKLWYQGHLQWHDLPAEFLDNLPIASEVIRVGQTDWWSLKPTFHFVKDSRLKTNIFPLLCFSAILAAGMVIVKVPNVILWWTYGLHNGICMYLRNPSKPSGDYMYHLLYQSVILHFVFMGLVWFSV